jgi:O-antigen/teichoic acid export membrane protein
MSKTRKAAAIALFGYLQFGVAIATGIFLVPLTLHAIGARTWGVWLASGEVLSYAGMADLGVLSILPWMLAEAEGRRDREALSKLVSQGVWLGAAVGIIYAALALALWQFLPSAMFLTPADRQIVGPPLAFAVLAAAIGYPITTYRALLTGVQDVFFNGILALGQAALAAVLAAVLLWKGFGLYALVFSAAVPVFLGHIASFIRAATIAPDVVWRFAPPRFDYLRTLLANGFGAWLGGLGWQLLAASNGIVITYMGHPELVPVYACTAKLSAMCMQLGWVLPDSSHIGLAQLHGARTSPERIRRVVIMVQRVHLLIAGATACILFAFNPAFVTRWVGPGFFAGLSLNALLAIGVILHSFVHGLVSSASIIGNRPKVGVLVLINGLIQTPLAVFLGHRFGLDGVAWAGLIAAVVTVLPGSIVLLRPTASLSARGLASELIAPWAARGMPWMLAAALVGALYQTLGVWVSGAIAGSIALAYAWQMRPLYATLPVEKRWADWLVRFRLIPAPPPIPGTGGPALEKMPA